MSLQVTCTIIIKVGYIRVGTYSFSWLRPKVSTMDDMVKNKEWTDELVMRHSAANTRYPQSIKCDRPDNSKIVQVCLQCAKKKSCPKIAQLKTHGRIDVNLFHSYYSSVLS